VPARRHILRVVVPAADEELATDALWAGDPSAVSSEDLGDGTVRLTADVAACQDLDLPWPAVVEEVDDADALDAWRPYARPARAGRSVVLQPAWLPTEAAPDDVVVVLDPGHAFGSGSHATTRLVLASLEAHLRGGERMLDIGCGSGVLAVGGCLLGAASAVGIDVDDAAVDATSANAAANGVADRITASTTPLAELGGAFDVVVANIGGQVLRELRDGLLERAAPGALLVLAGFLDAQADSLAAAYAGCTEVDRRSEDGWTVLTFRRDATEPPRRPPTG
jgi:ribosomal protein L11 methyltransferase